MAIGCHPQLMYVIIIISLINAIPPTIELYNSRHGRWFNNYSTKDRSIGPINKTIKMDSNVLEFGVKNKGQKKIYTVHAF